VTREKARGRVWIGPSGYAYPEWRGAFYPPDLPASHFLQFAASRFDSIEINSTFYRLASPGSFHAWAAAVQSPAFVYAVKGSRYITHDKKLSGVGTALANFYASGVLSFGARTGPFLWQLPHGLGFDADRMAAFLDQLPDGANDAARLARKHDARLTHGVTLRPEAPCRYRHAFEVRHPSFATDAFFRLLERRGAATVIADTAGKYPVLDAVTADFVYVRLHGAEALYASKYEDQELEGWADRVDRWSRGRDVYVYFDNTACGHAPGDALRLRAMLAARGVFGRKERLG
jgi:uncharacterized protein YecE (DUF72 family)